MMVSEQSCNAGVRRERTDQSALASGRGIEGLAEKAVITRGSLLSVGRSLGADSDVVVIVGPRTV